MLFLVVAEIHSRVIFVRNFATNKLLSLAKELIVEYYKYIHELTNLNHVKHGDVDVIRYHLINNICTIAY